MQTPKLRTLVEVGAIQRLSVAYNPAAGGWTVSIMYRANPDEKTEMLERQRGGVRAFTTMEAVIRYLARLGIRECQVSTQGYPPAQ